MGTIADAAALGPGVSYSAGEGSQGQPDIQNANAVGDEAIQTVADTAAQQKAAQIQQPGLNKLTYKWNPKTGQYDVQADIPSDSFNYLQNLITTGKAAQDAFSAARQQLAFKRVFQEQNPIVAGIGRIASTAAAQYGTGPFGEGRGRGAAISPIIRAAGAYGLDQFGQTPAELSQQEAGLQAQEFGVANQLTNQFQQQEIIQSERENRLAQAARADRGLNLEEQRLRENQKNSIFGSYEASAQKGQDSSQAFAAEASTSKLFTPAEIKAKQQALKLSAEAAQAAAKASKDLQLDLFKREQKIRMADAAAQRAANLKDAKAGATITSIRDVDNKIYALQKEQAQGFEAISAQAESLGLPKPAGPGDIAAARKIANAAVAAAMPDQKAAVAKTMASAIASLDPTKQITSMVKVRESYVKALPKEYADLGTRQAYDYLDEALIGAGKTNPTADDRDKMAAAFLKAAIDSQKVTPQELQAASADEGAFKKLLVRLTGNSDELLGKIVDPFKKAAQNILKAYVK